MGKYMENDALDTAVAAIIENEKKNFRAKIEQLMEDVESTTANRHMNDLEYSRWTTLQEVLELLDE